MKRMNFVLVKASGTIVHTAPEGNRHTLCGIVAECVQDSWAIAPLVTDENTPHRLCKNCNRVKPARDTSAPADPSLSEPTDVWTVTDKAGAEIARVYGETMADAREAARRTPAVGAVPLREGGFSLRRLTVAEERALEAVDALVESAWSTMTLHTVLRKDFGLHAEGRRVICASLAARGVTPEGVRVLNSR